MMLDVEDRGQYTPAHETQLDKGANPEWRLPDKTHYGARIKCELWTPKGENKIDMLIDSGAIESCLLVAYADRKDHNDKLKADYILAGLELEPRHGKERHLTGIGGKGEVIVATAVLRVKIQEQAYHVLVNVVESTTVTTPLLITGEDFLYNHGSLIICKRRELHFYPSAERAALLLSYAGGTDHADEHKVVIPYPSTNSRTLNRTQDEAWQSKYKADYDSS
jgi:hypothetical protein